MGQASTTKIAYTEEYSVRSELIDANGHLGNEEYVKYGEEHRIGLQTAYGITDANLAHWGIAQYVTFVATDYKNELHENEKFTLQTEMIGRGPATVYMQQNMIRNGHPVNHGFFECCFVDIESKKVISLRTARERVPHLGVLIDLLPDPRSEEYKKSRSAKIVKSIKDLRRNLSR